MKIFPQFQSSEGEYKTKFTDLNEDCFLLILERLDFRSLVNVAEINAEYSALAASVFRCKHSHLRIAVEGTFRISNNDRNELRNVAGMQVGNDTIERVNDHWFIGIGASTVIGNEIKLGNSKLILDTFKHFGHLIKKFGFRSFYGETFRMEMIGKLINKYSTKSLIDIYLNDKVEELLMQIKKPLITVASVTMRNCFFSDHPQILDANKLFPALRVLNLVHSDNRHFAYFDCHMPHLEHLTFRKNDNYGSGFVDVIKKNPQIQSIDLHSPYSEFINAVSKYLPQLEALTLRDFHPLSTSIQFENVTTFTIGYERNTQTSPTNLNFPRLQTVHMEYSSHVHEEYINFLNEHNNLSRLHVEMNEFEMQDRQFQQLTANLRNLVEVTLQQKDEKETLSSAIITEFLRSHENVNRFNLINFSKRCQEELQGQLSSEWSVKIVDSGLHIKRENRLF